MRNQTTQSLIPLKRFSSTTEKPTILIVQASFLTPNVYKSLRDCLEALGYSTVHPNLSVGREAAPEELSYIYRQARGLPGGVIRLFYFRAFIFAEGQSVVGVFGESTREDIRIRRSAAYRCIPSTYLISDNDKAALLQLQEKFAANAGATVDRCAAGHSVMLNHPAILASKIAAVADEAMRSIEPKP
ncbi:uncharacterized protein BDZ99DRAFT_539778 [Mytilinidion resinicola]|uniref:Alpha/beta-hydrolase n=1 Tax=Mytilinidion resinicola TaxID=574789 RepID=A0A6A6Y9E3_9PEZI|nr:uncharacterized protein BDZ99DRAFT_539778 [Mytilinidion resinicola]KAF2805442.1 hypothetical protein BDZ99DRAFT_539778 [Mytilinidion resinicola]